jgi:hypothetical protein
VTRSDVSSVNEQRRPFWEEAHHGLIAASQALKEVVTTNPSLALGLALGMGVVAGWLVKRR